MIDLSVLEGSSYVVLGLARSGLTTVRALMAAGIDCVAWDDNEAAREQAAAMGATLAEPVDHRLEQVHGAGDQPRHSQPPAQAASGGRRGARRRQAADLRRRAAGAGPARRPLRRRHRHQRQVDHHGADRPYPRRRPARRCEVGGNIGRGALDLAPLGPHGIYVLELSSYQLELLETFRAHVAVWLNITPDHIDRHGDMAGYVDGQEAHLRPPAARATAP